KSKSGSLRSHPHPPSGHLLPQAGEGLALRRARRRGVLSLRQVSLHKQRKVARAVTARKPLTLMSREPEQQAGQDPPHEALAERQAGQDPPCEAVTGDGEEQERLAALAPSSALRAPSPASGRRAGVVQGAQAGGAFFAPGFFAQAKKGGSRRHGAKALDLDVGGTEAAGGSRPALQGFGGTAGGSRPALRS